MLIHVNTFKNLNFRFRNVKIREKRTTRVSPPSFPPLLYNHTLEKSNKISHNKFRSTLSAVCHRREARYRELGGKFFLDQREGKSKTSSPSRVVRNNVYGCGCSLAR